MTMDHARLSMPVGETMFTQRSIRRFRPDPIPMDDIRLILEAASKAPNGGNRQIARFLVVTDRALIREFGALYHEAWWAKRWDERRWTKLEDIPPEDKSYRSAAGLADEMKEAPCVVLALAVPPGGANSVIPACQNLMLAARALGIGSVPTTLHAKVMDRFHALFGIPKDTSFHFAIPIGDPLGPDNMLVFMPSVINGLSLSGTNRYTAAAKSPLTGGYGESEAGGWWGPELRAAGFDGVTVRGRSEKPTYLWIKDSQVEFRDAQPYWGKLSGEVQDGLEAELGDKRIRVLQTGISGERGVRVAAIVYQLQHFHGRGGLRAVMGAKNLKAIVARGSRPPAAADKEKAKGQLVWFKEHYDRAKDRFHQLGSASAVLALEASGILPTRNFRDGSFEGARAISGPTMRDTILVNRGTCYACAVACKREAEVKELGVTPKYGGPEYETLAASGSLCGVSDLNALALINQLYAQYVLDSISTGAVVAFAMECYEHGIIPKEMTGGLERTWGKPDPVRP